MSLASGSDDGTIILWDAKLTPAPRASDAHADKIWSLTFSPDGRTLASAGGDAIKLWDVLTGQVRATTNTPGSNYATFSPDGRMLASAGNSISLWDAATGRPLGVFGTNNAYGVAFSPDGNSLASTGMDAIVRIWDVAAKSQRAALTGHSDFVWSVNYSADGKMLVSAGMTGGVKIWDATSGRLLRSIPEAAYFAKFSPDGATLETTRLSTEGHGVLIWDLATSTTRATLPAGVNGVGRNFAFSQNGSSLVAAKHDGSIREIDTVTGEELVVLPGDGHRCWAIAFSSDGRTVVSGSWTGKVRFWRAASEQEVMQQGLELKSGGNASTRPADYEP
jgi:WD40 repeat protein